MEKRQQILILTLALVVLFASIFFVVRNISTKSAVGNNQNLKENNNLQQNGSNQVLKKIDALGRIAEISEKTIVVKHSDETTTVNVDSNTSVGIFFSLDTSTPGSLADLRLGDAVKVTYDSVTKDAKIILVARPTGEAKK